MTLQASAGPEGVAQRQGAVLLCPQCGLEHPHRVKRKGFFETWIYSYFGYYPWRCNRCGSRFLLRKRFSGEHTRKRSHYVKDETPPRKS